MSPAPDAVPPAESEREVLRHLLIVAGESAVGEQLAGVLAGAGYIAVAVDSEQAATRQCADAMPDLLLLDAALPEPGGFELGRRLRQRFGDRCAPILFLAPDDARASVLAAFRHGGLDCLPRPFEPEEVVARVRTHLAARPIARRLNTLVAQLSRTNAAQKRLLGMVAHDLRNPLTSICGLAEFLRDGAVGPLSPDQLDLVAAIHAASQSMSALVNDLLDITAVESGVLRIAFEPCPVDTLVAKVVHLAAIDAAKKKIDLVCAFGAGIVVPADEGKLRQVVGNLVGNAIKYSPPGSAILIELAEVGGKCRFSVRDQGPGIPDDERHRLFQDFGRLSVPATGGEKSTGLGLAISRNIIEAHGGTIGAENLPDGGCEFHFVLPLTRG